MVEVIRNTNDNRFELLIDGEVAGYSAYEELDNSIVFTHTEVDASRQEHGLGGQLVRAALDQIRDTTSRRVVARCPYVAHWISKHPDYQGLLSR